MPSTDVPVCWEVRCTRLCLESVQAQAVKTCPAHQAGEIFAFTNIHRQPAAWKPSGLLHMQPFFLYFQGNTATWWLLLELPRWPEGRCKQEEEEEAARSRRREVAVAPGKSQGGMLQLLVSEKHGEEIYPGHPECGEEFYQYSTGAAEHRGSISSLKGSQCCWVQLALGGCILHRCLK